jgi:hypothetical protein
VKLFAALVVGYLVGARTGAKDLDELGRSLKALCETDEFADVVTAARAHLGTTLRELAAVVDGGTECPAPGATPAESGGDLVSRVSRLVGRS